MTPAERKLLEVLAISRLGELKGGLDQIDKILSSQQLPEQDKAFLVMQRAQLGSALQELAAAVTDFRAGGRIVTPG